MLTYRMLQIRDKRSCLALPITRRKDPVHLIVVRNYNQGRPSIHAVTANFAAGVFQITRDLPKSCVTSAANFSPAT